MPTIVFSSRLLLELAIAGAIIAGIVLTILILRSFRNRKGA